MTKEELQSIRQIMQEELKPIREEFEPIKEDLKLIWGELEPIKEDLKLIWGELEPIKERLTKIEIKIENETDRAIKTISEGHLDLNRKLEEKISLENRVEKLEHKMSAVEFSIQKRR